jgi:imidazolonepropionase-like amidohydrolase
VRALPALVIVAERLIDGTGRDPIERAAIVIENGRITAAGARSSLTIPADADVLEDDDLTLLPGFMDMHVHLAASTPNLVRILMTPASLDTRPSASVSPPRPGTSRRPACNWRSAC